MNDEVLLGDVNRLGIECSDCGRNRWKAPGQMLIRGVTLRTPLSVLAKKLSCSACQDDGLPGKTVSIQAYFAVDADRTNFEAQVLRNQEALSVGSRAISS